MNPSDLLDVAEVLAMARAKRVYLRRASSTTYYAMFHTLTNCCADTLIGPAGHRDDRGAWQRTYRALDHGTARSQCAKARAPTFSPAIVDFSRDFVAMQAKRHAADYDPYARFYRSACLLDIQQARASIQNFGAEPLVVRRSFASYLLFRTR